LDLIRSEEKRAVEAALIPTVARASLVAIIQGICVAICGSVILTAAPVAAATVVAIEEEGTCEEAAMMVMPEEGMMGKVSAWAMHSHSVHPHSVHPHTVHPHAVANENERIAAINLRLSIRDGSARRGRAGHWIC
jgi:hypothetical protein